MPRCEHHPGRESVLIVNQKNYCAECQSGIVAARGQVDRHVEPKDCFVTYVGANNWQPITGTGCAHWVAHQLGIRSRAGEDQCLEGCILRVKTLVRRTTAVPLANVRVNDIVEGGGDYLLALKGNRGM
jgi:hydroxyethylthiazole kinase-like sugar kinase family protein